MWNEEEDRIVLKAEKQNWFPCHHVEKKFYSYLRCCIVLFFCGMNGAKTEQRIEMKNSTKGICLVLDTNSEHRLNVGLHKNIYAFDAVTGVSWRVYWDSVASTRKSKRKKNTQRFFYSWRTLGVHTAGVFSLDQTHFKCLSCIEAATFHITFGTVHSKSATGCEKRKCNWSDAIDSMPNNSSVHFELNYKILKLIYRLPKKFHHHLNRIATGA